MKFTLSWLQNHLVTKLDLDAILELMLKAGLEVEHVDNPAERLAAFSVAKVRAAEPHPDADRLRVCRVDTVDGEKQIVCGAPNARAGMTAIYAPPGTYIPGLDFALDKKPRKIRGVESQGMLCSTKELEAGEDHDGIADLEDRWPLGTPAAEALGAGDGVIDFEVTPNRPDWLGVAGIARDLAAAGGGRFLPQPIKAPAGRFACPVEIGLEAEEACPVFAGAVITGVRNATSPNWMQARLKAVGIQPRNLLVDVTNYVSLDRARPLHAYDAQKLTGAVTARLARDGETLAALDGKTYTLDTDMCVIADESGVIGLGGVMGGEQTAVSEETTEVFIESAWFDPDRTARTGRKTGIHSDARYRFERGVDRKSCLDGLEQAIELIHAHGGGKVSERLVVGSGPPQPAIVTFHPGDVARLTGLDIRTAEMKRLVKALGFEMEDAGDAWYLTPPSWRFDIFQSADLVEEIARLSGYDALPVASLPAPAEGREARPTTLQTRVRIARRAMAARGFLETVTWSFMARSLAAEFSEDPRKLPGGLTIANPVASDLDQMRPTILANLARAAQRAADRGERELKLFEAGPIYLGDGPGDQRTVVTALVRPDPPRHWQAGPPPYDAHAAKADLLALLEALDQPPSRFQIDAPREPYWHPGQAARLKLGPRVTVARFGALHPRILKALDVDGPVFGFELNLNALPRGAVRSTKTRPVMPVTDQTPVRRDLAFIVDEEVAAGDLTSAAQGADKALITGVHVFDVYQGQGIEPGMKSLALEITISPRGRALSDAEIDGVIGKVIEAVARKTGGVLRS